MINEKTSDVIGSDMVSTATSPVAAVAPVAATAVGRPPTSLLFSRGNLTSRSVSGNGDKSVVTRPSTAVRAVGYAANNDSSGQRFDQIILEKAKQQTLSTANASVEVPKEVNPQIKYKNLEIKILKLLEASILSTTNYNENNINGNNSSSPIDMKNSLVEALNKAKEAFSLDRTLHRFRDQHGENVFHNFELTYAVFFNLAEQYDNNDMHIEALNTYNIMTKNKMFPHVNQLKLNMGNIYFKMGIYPKAIKMYRMALDSVPNNLKQLRLKITKNIGILFVRMGQYADAAASFEFIMSERADIHSAIHLILCYYAMGDVEKIKSTFRNLCDVQSEEIETDLENENNIFKLQQHASATDQTVEEEQQMLQAHSDENNGDFEFKNGESFDISTGSKKYAKSSETGLVSSAINKNRYVIQSIKFDELAVYTKQRRNNEKRAITMIVDLISPVIEENYNDGYNWCIEVIKTSNLSWLVNELELNKALVYLRQNDINQAIETLQMYERKSDDSMTANALTNLTFIYINLSNFDMAAHCVDQLNDNGALKTNVPSLVNASIIDTHRGDFRAAREKLERALQIMPDNFEANYNLGLIALKENDLQMAENQFENLKKDFLVPHSVQHTHVLYQLARLQEKLQASTMDIRNFKSGNTPAVLQSFLQVLGLSAAEIDSRLYEKVGNIYEQIQAHQEANQYYNEAYRINPSDIIVASSIGSYYIKIQATEKAIYYYERAVLANPNDPNLMLRIASCFRNSYMPPKQYLNMFERIYIRFPDNLTCVRALMQVTKSLGMTELHEKYSMEHSRLRNLQVEKQNEQRHQQTRLLSASSGSSSNRIKSQNNVNQEVVSTRMTENIEGTRNIGANFIIQHNDPLGPPTERPRTGMLKPSHSLDSDDEEINADSLLPI